MIKSMIEIAKLLLKVISLFCSLFTLFMVLEYFFRLSEDDEYDSDVYYFEDDSSEKDLSEN